MATRIHQSSTVTQLRALMPNRPLSVPESLRIAELQASRLLELSGVTSGPTPESVVASLPRLQVKRSSPLPVSGYADWQSGQWVIVLNGAEGITRQRFSLFHEMKHVLDHPFIDFA